MKRIKFHKKIHGVNFKFDLDLRPRMWFLLICELLVLGYLIYYLIGIFNG